MRFLDPKQGHFMVLIIGLIVAGVVGVDYADPAYLQDSGEVAVTMILAIAAGLPLNAVIQGPRHPHIEHSIADPKSGVFYAPKDFYIDQDPEPTRKVPDIWPMMKKGAWCENDKKWMQDETVAVCPACGQPTELYDVPEHFWGRWWYPYLVRVRWGVSFGEFHDAPLHLFILPAPWKAFMHGDRRVEGAQLMGEFIDHSNSVHVDSILAPFVADFGAKGKVPIYISILSSYTVLAITKSWESAMNDFARYIREMDRVMRENEESIFPRAELEKTVQKVYPELKIERRAS